MQVSNCCESKIVVVTGYEGTSYYQCLKCHEACDAVEACK